MPNLLNLTERFWNLKWPIYGTFRKLGIYNILSGIFRKIGAQISRNGSVPFRKLDMSSETSCANTDFLISSLLHINYGSVLILDDLLG